MLSLVVCDYRQGVVSLDIACMWSLILLYRLVFLIRGRSSSSSVPVWDVNCVYFRNMDFRRE